MNRLAPLIVRRAGPLALAAAPAAAGSAGTAAPAPLLTEEQAARLGDDLRLFLTGWLGGLVFFGTFLA